jgi:hypothetical protein
VVICYCFAKSINPVRQKASPPTLTLPLSFDPEALDGEGGGEGGGDFLWLRLRRAVFIWVPSMKSFVRWLYFCLVVSCVDLRSSASH